MDEATLRETSAWLDQYAMASEQLQNNAAAAAGSSWATFTGWYASALVAELAAESAALSLAAQEAAAALSSGYIEMIWTALTGTAPDLAPPALPPARQGVDLRLVQSRPVEEFRRAVATSSGESDAVAAAVRRAENLARSDIALAEREAQRQSMVSAGVEHYRRVIRPELSESGTCGLCIAASDQVYRVQELMPIHPPHCKCKTMPIVGDADPGRSLNDSDLKQLYSDAGSTKAAALKRTRYRVNEHGELGPVLTKRGDHFRGPAEVRLEDDPARAARMLEKVLPVLDTLESRAAAGEDVSGPLGYQRSLVERLRRITA